MQWRLRTIKLGKLKLVSTKTIFKKGKPFLLPQKSALDRQQYIYFLYVFYFAMSLPFMMLKQRSEKMACSVYFSVLSFLRCFQFNS